MEMVEYYQISFCGDCFVRKLMDRGGKETKRFVIRLVSVWLVTFQIFKFPKLKVIFQRLHCFFQDCERFECLIQVGQFN